MSLRMSDSTPKRFSPHVPYICYHAGYVTTLRSSNLNCRISKAHYFFSTLFELLCPGRIPSGGERTFLDSHASGHSDRHHHHPSITMLRLSRVSIIRKTEVSDFQSAFFLLHGGVFYIHYVLFCVTSHYIHSSKRTVQKTLTANTSFFCTTQLYICLLK
jgi:hypothetical protein